MFVNICVAGVAYHYRVDFAAFLLMAAAIGAGLGVLFAPRSGKDTRKMLKDKMDELIDKARDLDAEEVKQTIEAKIVELKKEIADLDKEKVLSIAKKKAKKIQDAAQELVSYAIEKGTPVLESAADQVRQKAVVVTKEVLNKLEKEDK